MKRNNKFVSRLLLAVLLAGGVTKAQTDSSEEQKPASISGVVSNSVTGQPLAHAEVILSNAPGPQACSLMQNTCRFGVSTADGTFSIRTIAPGRYQMLVLHEGYGPLGDEDDERKALELKSGDEIKDIVLRLVPDAVISGRVLDAKGEPVEHASVAAVGGGGTPWPAVTDDQGQFRIGRLRGGRYLVKTILRPSELGPPEIRTDGTAEVNCSSTYYPSAPDAESAALVDVRPGQETSGIDIKLVPAPILHVSGTVLAHNGQQQCGDVVSLSGGSSERVARTVSGGTVTFWRVPPGRYQLFAGSFPPEGVPVEINVTSADVEGIQLLCHESLQVAGQVEVEGGTPIPDQKGLTPSLKLLPLGSILSHTVWAKPIDKDGTFKVTNACPCRYHLIGEGMPENFYVKSAHLGTIELQDGILDLRDSDPSAVMTVQLGTNGAEVSGVVRSVKGPSAGVRVTLFFDDEYGSDVAGTTATGADGRYALHGLAPGKYKIVAYDPKSSAAVWSKDALALYASVMESIDAREGDRILQDLKLLTWD